MRALWGVALAGAVALTGCGDSSAEPRVLPSASAPASASPSPVSTGRNAPTPQGAEAFARYFYKRIEEGFRTRDPALISELSTSSCKSCQQYVASMTKLRDNNERVEGFHITLSTALSPALENPGSARVDVIWSYDGARRFDASGRLLREEPATSGIEEQVDLIRMGDTWRVSEITRIRVRG